MGYVIEKDVPPPWSRKGQKSELRLEIEKMDVGCALFVGDVPGRNIAVMLTNIKKKTGRKFTRRTVEGGNRIWRIA